MQIGQQEAQLLSNFARIISVLRFFRKFLSIEIGAVGIKVATDRSS